MLNLATGAGAGLKISDVELNRSGPSYTIDTVHYFKQTLPAETRLHLIMGLDAFLEIDTWKSFKDLLTQIPLIVLFQLPGPLTLPGTGNRFMFWK